MNSKIVEFEALPASVEDIDNSVFYSPFDVAAETVAALCVYEKDPDAAIRMLDHLRLSGSMGVWDTWKLRRRLKGREHIPFSFFDGADPSNGYRPSLPYRLEVYATQMSYLKDDEVRLYIQSKGARPAGSVTLVCRNFRWYLKKEELLGGIRSV